MVLLGFQRYAALALSRMAVMAGWLGDSAGQQQWAKTSSTIVASMKAKLYNPTTGNVKDGVGIEHYSLHATMFAAMVGIQQINKQYIYIYIYISIFYTTQNVLWKTDGLPISFSDLTQAPLYIYYADVRSTLMTFRM